VVIKRKQIKADLGQIAWMQSKQHKDLFVDVILPKLGIILYYPNMRNSLLDHLHIYN